MTFTHLRGEGSLIIKKHGWIKPVVKGVGNTTAILCGTADYVEFIELSLCMHAYLHHSADLPDNLREDTVVFDRGVREFVRLFGKLVCRGDSSVDTDTCKTHCFMHLLSNTVEFGDPMQHDSGKGERGLKQWAKAASATAQKSGLDTFLFQTMMRVADRLLLSRASDVVKRQDQQERAEKEKVKGIMKRKQPHFRWHRVDDKVVAINSKGIESPTTAKTGTILVNVMSHLHKTEVEMQVIDMWCETKLPSARDSTQPQFLRAHPNLDKFGGFFDWVDAKFDVMGVAQDSSDEMHMAPAARLLRRCQPGRRVCRRPFSGVDRRKRNSIRKHTLDREPLS
jgi:hypothetical protein